jgi:hypothetical protein
MSVLRESSRDLVRTFLLFMLKFCLNPINVKERDRPRVERMIKINIKLFMLIQKFLGEMKLNIQWETLKGMVD